MATLTITDIPDDLHTQLTERARRNGRSLEQEIVATLNRAASKADDEVDVTVEEP